MLTMRAECAFLVQWSHNLMYAKAGLVGATAVTEQIHLNIAQSHERLQPS